MKKIIIHSEEIQKKGAKIQFQIKLPETIEQVRSVLATISRVPDAAQSPIDPNDVYIGSLWLRIPENRDVFYADIVRQSNHKLEDISQINKIGIVSEPEWWFSGTQQPSFDVTVPIEDQIIEGYFQDESQFAFVNYTLRIYLTLHLHD